MRETCLEKLAENVPKAVEDGIPLSPLCIPGNSPYLFPVAQLSPTRGMLGYMPKGF